MTITTLSRAKFRVKIKSLAAEARIIRQEELRTAKHILACHRYVVQQLDAPQEKCNLLEARIQLGLAEAVRADVHAHRVGSLRAETRATLLAYALCRNIPITVIEPNGKQSVDIKRVMEIIKSLTGRVVPPAQILDWSQRVPVTA